MFVLRTSQRPKRTLLNPSACRFGLWGSLRVHHRQFFNFLLHEGYILRNVLNSRFVPTLNALLTRQSNRGTSRQIFAARSWWFRRCEEPHPSKLAKITWAIRLKPEWLRISFIKAITTCILVHFGIIGTLMHKYSDLLFEHWLDQARGRGGQSR